jgi:glutathione gamma-glutamylcysteinyltransferase
MAKYCMEDVPDLLKDESVDNVPALLSRLVKSLPANAGNLIKWVIEVRRQEEGGSGLSKEEEERLILKVIFNLFFSIWDSGSEFSFCLF